MSESGVFAKSFLCESELGYLNDSAQRHGEYHDITVRRFLQIIIDNHNADVAGDDIDKTFKLGIVDVDSSTGTLYRYLGYESTFDTIKDKLIDRLGGELRVRKVDGVRYLDYVKSIGEQKSTEIRIAKNLKSITKETDPSDIITRLIPLGERIESDDEDATDASEARLTIESVNNGKDYIDDKAAMAVFGVIAKSESWDDITQPNILKTRGQQFLNENNRVKSKYSLSALDLSLIDLDIDSFDVGNWHPVKNPIMDIDDELRIVGKTTDILAPEASSLEIGDKFMTASDYQKEANQSTRKIVNLENDLTRERKRVREVSASVKNAQVEIERLQTIIENANVEELEQVIIDINNQLGSLFNNLGDIGQEIIDLQFKVDAIEQFVMQQEQINNAQASKNEDFEQRLLILENKEEGGSE